MRSKKVVVGLGIAFAAAVMSGCGFRVGGGGAIGDSAAPTYTVGGTLSGATAGTTLKLNGANDMAAGNGTFVFPVQLAAASAFNVQVVNPAERCTVTRGAGTIGAADVTDVAVTCAAQGAEMVVRAAHLDGAQELSGSGGAGTGVGGVIVDPATRSIRGGITFSGLTRKPTAAQIHRDDTSVALSLVLASDNATAVLPAGAQLSFSDYNELLAGTLYFNVQTLANPNGEIRGQINLQGGVGAAAPVLDAAQEFPASMSAATGAGTLIFDMATHKILIAYITHNVTNAIVAHIHTSLGPATNGNSIVGLPNLATNFDGAGNNLAYPSAGVQLSDQNVADYLADDLYFNVDSANDLCPPDTDCLAGEIRGNLVHMQ